MTTALVVNNDLTSTNGTVAGTQNLTVSGGDIACGASCGSINLIGGTTNLSGTGNFGTNALASNWTFYDLTFGDGAAEVSTSQGTGTITVSNVLTVAATHELNAGNKTWTLSKSGTGAGKPLVATGTFTASTSTVSYEGGAATDVTLVTYNNLTANGTGPFTVEAGTLTVGGNMTDAEGTLNLGGTTNVTGNASIESGGTLVSTSDVLTITGNYSNLDTFTHNSGTVTFDATDAGNTLSGTLNGSSSFNKVIFNGTGGEWTIQDAMKVSADSADTFVIGNGTVTLGNGGGDNLEINGRMTIAAASGQTGTFQTMDGLTQGDSTDCNSDDICIDVNNNASPVSCANCIIQVGTTGADAGQGNFKIRENALVRLNPFTTATDTGIEVEKNGYLEILGDQDDTGTDTGTDSHALRETKICANESWNDDDHNNKHVRMTSGLAIGKIYTITDTIAPDTECLTDTDDSISRTDNTSDMDTDPTTSGGACSGTGTCTVNVTETFVVTDNDHIGRYIHNLTDDKYYLIVDSDENTQDTIKIVTDKPDAFTTMGNGDDIEVTDGIKAADTFEILDYAHIS
ncbi:MAG: hypothetical protein KAJ19_22085, partial [Gammaproteobacteria bacterium]|nr:hypothetical protein [Gammaproteobacteria bacterium]